MAVAEDVARQCEGAEIWAEVKPLDKVNLDDLAVYPGLVIVLPAAWDRTLAAPDRLAELLDAYRSRRPDGLQSLLDGRCPWFKAGVVQVIGPRAVLDHPALRPIFTQDRACVRHYLGEQTLNLLRPYDRPARAPAQPPAPAVDPSMNGDLRVRRLWQHLRSWGVTSIRSVPELRACVEKCRRHYENPSYSAMYRPVNSIDANRLSIILDGIEYQPTELEKKTWTENGARAWRHLEKQLQEIEPGLSRPGGRGNTKDAQRDLYLFYTALCPLDEYLKLVPESDWEALFMAD